MAVQAAQLVATVEVAGADEGVAQLQSVGAAADEAQASLTALGTGAGEGLAASLSGADEALAGLSEEASAAAANFAQLDASMAELSQMTAEGAAAASGIDEVAAAAASADGALSSLATEASVAGEAVASIAADSGALSAAAGAASELGASLGEVAATAGEADGALASSIGDTSGLGEALAALSEQVGALSGEMGLLVGEVADLGASVDELAASEDAAGASAGGMEAGLGGMGIQLGVVAVAAGMLGEHIMSMAGNFEEGITQLQTGGGELASNLDMVSQHILQMAQDTGESTSQLEQGMYMLESSGLHGAAGLEVLRVSAEGAQVGNAQLETVASAVSTVLTDYHMKSSDAAEAMNALTETVASGKTHLQDLASSMGTVLPLASSLHIAFPQVAGALAVMTNAGMDARRASMELANSIRSLAAPNSVAQKAMEGVGISAQHLKDVLSHQGLEAAIQLVSDAVGKKFPAGSVQAVEAFKAIMGGATGYNVALMLTGKNMSAFDTDVKNIAASMSGGSKAVSGWSKVQQDFNFQMNHAKEVLEVLGIQIGTALEPVVGRIAGVISNTVVPALVAFAHNSSLFIPVLAGLGAAIIAFTISALAPMAVAVIAATWPFLAIGVAVAGLVAIFKHFYDTSAGFRSFINGLVSGLQAAWHTISSGFQPALQQVGKVMQSEVLPILRQVGSFLLSTFKPVWTQLQQVWQQQLLPTFRLLGDAFARTLPFFKLLGAVVGGVLVVGFGLLVGIITGVIKAFANLVGSIAIVIGGIVKVIAGGLSVVGGIISFFVDLFTGHFDKLGSDLQHIMQGVITMFSGAWDIISGVFRAVFGTIWGLVSGFVEGVIGFFQHLFDMLVGHSIIPDMVKAVLQWFSNLVSEAISFVTHLVTEILSWMVQMEMRVLSTITLMVNLFLSWLDKLTGGAVSKAQSLVSGITGVIGKLPGLALSWGRDLIGNLISGIESMAGNLTSAVSNIAGNIAKFLHFSKPDVGPLADADRWMGDLGDMLQKGLKEQAPKLASASLTVAQSVAHLAPRAASATPALGSSMGASGTVTFVIQLPDITLDGQKLTHAQMPYIVQHIRQSTGARI